MLEDIGKNGQILWTIDQVKRYIDEGIRRERQRCAKIAEQHNCTLSARVIAAKILAGDDEHAPNR